MSKSTLKDNLLIRIHLIMYSSLKLNRKSTKSIEIILEKLIRNYDMMRRYSTLYEIYL